MCRKKARGLKEKSRAKFHKGKLAEEVPGAAGA